MNLACIFATNRRNAIDSYKKNRLCRHTWYLEKQCQLIKFLFSCVYICLTNLQF